MRTDLEVIIDGINTLLATSPQTTSNHGGLVVWEHTRDKALVELLQKLKEAPFYAITTTTPNACDCGTCECDLDDEIEEDVRQMAKEAIVKLAKKTVECDKYKTALEKLAKLGGGNSDGNWIALNALKEGD